MKILVLSDSHASLSFMRRCIEAVKPDAIVHLGDHYDDAGAMKEEFPGTPLHRVPGNCDRYRCEPGTPEILIHRVCGVNLYMTHGHRHNVKLYLGALLRDAREARVDAVLFGHTHEPYCQLEGDGLWVMNPGSCGYYGGSAGVIRVRDGRIQSCELIRDEDLLRPW